MEGQIMYPSQRKEVIEVLDEIKKFCAGYNTSKGEYKDGLIPVPFGFIDGWREKLRLLLSTDVVQEEPKK